MSFDDLLTNTVTILKNSGEKYTNVKANVQTSAMLIQRTDLLIESGDLVQHSLSNGSVDTYKVIDPGFHEQFHGIPAGYQMKVKKLGIPEAKSAVQHITYNISGTNNRVNQNSTDNSVNMINMTSDMQDQVEALRQEIVRLKLDRDKAISANEIIDSIESQLQSDKPSISVVKALLAGLPHVGSIAAIGSFIVSLLG